TQLTHGSLTESQALNFGRSRQPCLLVINHRSLLGVSLSGFLCFCSHRFCKTSSMSPPKSSPRRQLSFFGSVPPLQAYLPHLDPSSGFPGSPSSVRRGTRRSSSL